MLAGVIGSIVVVTGGDFSFVVCTTVCFVGEVIALVRVISIDGFIVGYQWRCAGLGVFIVNVMFIPMEIYLPIMSRISSILHGVLSTTRLAVDLIDTSLQITDSAIRMSTVEMEFVITNGGNHGF